MPPISETEAETIPATLEALKDDLHNRLNSQDTILQALQDRMNKMEGGVATIIEFFAGAASAFKFFNFMGKIIAPVLTAAGTVAAVWAAYKAGGK